MWVCKQNQFDKREKSFFYVLVIVLHIANDIIINCW